MSIPTTEALYEWELGVTLNNRAQLFPRYWVDQIPGLRNLGEPEDIRDAAFGRLGEVSRRSLRRGKTVSFEGTVEATTIPSLESAVDDLQAAFAPMEREYQMRLYTLPVWGSSDYYFLAKPQGCEVSTKLEVKFGYIYQYAFTIAVRMSDPRIYGTGQVTAVTGSLVSTTAGLAFPAAGLAVPLAGVLIPAGGTSSGSSTVTYTGKAPADPIIDLYGPATNPRVMNDTVGAELRFSPLTISSGSFLRIDFGKRQVLLEGESDYRFAMDMSSSTWWDEGVPGLQPGDNIIRYRGDIVTDPAHAEIRYSPAYW